MSAAALVATVDSDDDDSGSAADRPGSRGPGNAMAAAWLLDAEGAAPVASKSSLGLNHPSKEGAGDAGEAAEI